MTDTDRPTYRISTWDPGVTPEYPWHWNPRYVGLEHRQLRMSLLVLRRLGYVEGHSILVEREEVPFGFYPGGLTDEQ